MEVQSLWELEPSNGSGSWSLGLEWVLLAVTIFLIALAKAAISASGIGALEVLSGVSSSTGSECADLRFVDILVGGGGWVGGWVAGLEVPELSRRVKLSTNPAL